MIARGTRHAPFFLMINPVQIVVAYDFSPSAEQAVIRAVEIALRAPQHVLHVVVALDPRTGLAISPPPHHVDYEYAEQIQRLVTVRMADAMSGRESAGDVQFFVHARIGKPADQILHLAREVGADLIVIGSHGSTGLERFVLGSVSEHVMREARCAVLVARSKGYADVRLAAITENPHEHAAYHPPHRYSYSNQQVIKRPIDWVF